MFLTTASLPAGIEMLHLADKIWCEAGGKKKGFVIQDEVSVNGIIVKRGLDIFLSLLLIILLVPLILAIVVLIKSDGGSVFFLQRRVGRFGGNFYCFKFRTMCVDAERLLAHLITTDSDFAAEWTATRKLRRDPRITRLGQVLRRTSLDELPQLWNVLRGDMSLIGPRPIVDAEIPLYGPFISYYYQVRPGMTGLWQVTGRSNTTYKRRVALDTWYVKNRSLAKDIKILAATIPALLRAQGAR